MNIISDALQAQSDAALHLLCFQALSVGGEAPYGTGGGTLIGYDAQCSKMGFHATAQFPQCHRLLFERRLEPGDNRL